MIRSAVPDALDHVELVRRRRERANERAAATLQMVARDFAAGAADVITERIAIEAAARATEAQADYMDALTELEATCAAADPRSSR